MKEKPDEYVAKAYDRIIDLYENWDKPEQVKEWRKKRPPLFGSR